MDAGTDRRCYMKIPGVTGLVDQTGYEGCFSLGGFHLGYSTRDYGAPYVNSSTVMTALSFKPIGTVNQGAVTETKKIDNFLYDKKATADNPAKVGKVEVFAVYQAGDKFDKHIHIVLRDSTLKPNEGGGYSLDFKGMKIQQWDMYDGSEKPKNVGGDVDEE